MLGHGPQRVGRRRVDVFQDRLEAGAVLHGDDQPAAVLDDLQDPLGAVYHRHAGHQHADAAGRRRAAGGCGRYSAMAFSYCARSSGMPEMLLLSVQQLPAGQRRRIGLHQRRQFAAAAPARGSSRAIASRSRQSVIARAEAVFQKAAELLQLARTNARRASGSSAFCGSSSTYIGRDRPISSYIFFLPSQVVSATTRSAISRNGLLRWTW